MICVEVIYLLIATTLFTIWLDFFKRDRTWKTQERLAGFVTLVVATVFWPLVLPIAYIEILKSKSQL
ncbi:hypothetical protein NDI37_07955 [Funiculus sociatus GB2-A5]|jgi:hypothetical protein|uniref:Uncharacterized protein n=1 Tax=Funiculus sociatus GB2-A5 TaxID=2933946 RepID=A0ABV0JLU7_9CYAN|nr:MULTISPECIES: hypothetical protein [unclassified Trichocoleus]MBD1907169.1 hypothetical protein [Trichocoleus sp. FACHB-832]MBD2004569.1 hypothetical protein [Trichocoleus sp. FACHB-40]MBD2064212.1 hypothetical protein [Trichocoleus sp. FACHB-6]